jgi:hypothetical protein
VGVRRARGAVGGGLDRPADALALGVVGAVLWVGVAQLLSWLVDRAARDTAQLADAQREASEWLASQEGMRRERRTVQRALAVAGPVLARTIAVGGLDPRERQLARVAEATLRDELRGRRCSTTTCARRSPRRGRGATVSVLDEGGSTGSTPRPGGRARRARGRARFRPLGAPLRPHVDARGVAVTVVGRSAGADGEEEVDLWHEMRRRR